MHPVARFVADVERVDAAGRLRQMAEERAAARRDRMRQHRAVDPAVQHEQHGVPRRVFTKPRDGGQHAVEQFAGSFRRRGTACLPARRRRTRTETLLDILGRKLLQLCRRESPPTRARFRSRRLDPFRSSTRRAVSTVRGSPLAITRSKRTLLGRERPAGGAGFLASAFVQRHADRIDRAAGVVEVGDVAVTHQEDAAAFRQLVFAHL